jgi:hypothetical protein
MIKAGSATWAVAVLGMFAVAATAARAAHKPGNDGPLPIVISVVQPADCEVSVRGQSFILPADDERLLSALRDLRRDWKAVRVIGKTEIPYRCIGYAIFIAQRSGFKNVRFQAVSPASDKR